MLLRNDMLQNASENRLGLLQTKVVRIKVDRTTHHQMRHSAQTRPFLTSAHGSCSMLSTLKNLCPKSVKRLRDCVSNQIFATPFWCCCLVLQVGKALTLSHGMSGPLSIQTKSKQHELRSQIAKLWGTKYQRETSVHFAHFAPELKLRLRWHFYLPPFFLFTRKTVHSLWSNSLNQFTF